MIRRLLFAAFVLTTSLSACGGDSTSPPKTAVQFKVDEATCEPGTFTLGFYVDGTVVGSETLGVGILSKRYGVTPGHHILGAKVSNTDYEWPDKEVDVEEDATYTYTLSCLI
jgi:hypothetical protein